MKNGCLVLIGVAILILVVDVWSSSSYKSPTTQVPKAAAPVYTGTPMPTGAYTASISESAAVKREASDMQSAFQLFNDKMQEKLFHGVDITDKDIAIKIDADYWDPMSKQDQDQVFNAILDVWAKEYKQVHGTEADSGNVTFYDLAGNRVKWDMISVGP